ncbi:TPA: hypothetical protein F3L18_18535 [Aeromonas hydrophila]|nr:hypothetical protein [Aeromonas hydrophila]HAU4862232.1 hypothetical protein [Aeromonas hydrophila]HAU4865613.1 hypothetical protein [Aeromonas hydrophila]HAU4879494.1 hypothetical protein [Aeromonas hydrophila]HAU4903605.1 hypothetical protein [Aeromonas hydrophila]
MAELLVKTLVRPFMTIPDRLNTSTGCLAVASAIRVNCLFCHYRSCHVVKPCRGAGRPVLFLQADGRLLGRHLSHALLIFPAIQHIRAPYRGKMRYLMPRFHPLNGSETPYDHQTQGSRLYLHHHSPSRL